MPTFSIKRKIMAHLNRLTEEQQHKVLISATYLATAKYSNNTNTELQNFTNNPLNDDIKNMIMAIEPNSEQIYLNEW